MTGLLSLALPIARVDLLSEQSHAVKGGWFPDMRDLVLEPLRQPVVEVVPQSTFAITSYLARISIELDDVLRDLLAVRHGQTIQTMLGVADGIMGPKIRLEFVDELAIVLHPARTEPGIIAQQEVGLEPIERHTLEEGLSVDHLHAIIVEGFGAVLEVELALDQEGAELLRVGTVELVRFTDFRPPLGLSGLTRGGRGSTSERGDSLRELAQDVACIFRLIVTDVVVIATGVRRVRRVGRTGRKRVRRIGRVNRRVVAIQGILVDVDGRTI